MNYWDELVQGATSTVGGSPQIIVGLLRGGMGFYMTVKDGLATLEILPFPGDSPTGNQASMLLDRFGAHVLGSREYREEFNRLYPDAHDIYFEAGPDCG